MKASVCSYDHKRHGLMSSTVNTRDKEMNRTANTNVRLSADIDMFYTMY